jgi:glyoxylase-like metal-dependent hydrolase (beta-lactamase superfamily II)
MTVTTSARVVAMALGVLALICGGARAAQPVASVRLYAIDCGRIDFTDMGLLSDTGEYDGRRGSLVDPCFLVRHPRGTLLWDTGLGDARVGHDSAPNSAGVSLHVGRRLLDQLALAGIVPADITFIAFSHLHLDHTGNANEFVAAIWILNKAELDWALGTPTPALVDPATFRAYRSARTRMIGGDYDVFGDGTVRILAAPGHTPGHQVLQLRLARAGTVLLSGDLYHLRADRPHGGHSGRVAVGNTDRAQSLASMDRIEAILRNTHGRLVIQHDPQDFRALPRFPAYLD